MVKRRKKISVPAAVASPTPIPPRTAPPTREIDILAGGAGLICIVFGYLSMQAVNPDGVSYLDLAAAVQRGDWTHFVQGYWSPLLPFLTGIAGSIGGLSGPQLVPVTHALNLVVALGALLIIWLWARQAATPWFARAAIATFMICSAGLPRIEAVTPDVLLLATVIWLSYELLVHGSQRWLLVGTLLGVAFLAKTSSWPWLVVAVPLRLWTANAATARRRIWKSTLVAGAVMLIWVVPMTIKYGHPTLGSSGRLNYSWYIAANSSRLPDSDAGRNSAYQSVPVGEGREVTVATFDDAAFWTYQPWGDPTAWATKVLTQTGHTPTAFQLVSYWFRLALRIVALWLGPLVAAVLLPVGLLARRPGMLRDVVTTQRDAMAVMLLGVAGVAQFAAIHAEPRLIAPYAAMAALGVISWCVGARRAAVRLRPVALREALAWIGIVTALGFAAFRLAEGVTSHNRLQAVTRQLDDLRHRLAVAGQSGIQLGLVGPAAPILGSAYWIGAHITMQIPPTYADLIATLPPDQQSRMLTALFSGKVPMVWQTSANGGMRILIVPPRQ
ncbi:MAG: hypothetical protein ACRELE_07225 [Gemmatimonadales bacterium]